MSNFDIDLRGQRCPMTTIKLKRHLKTLPAGTTFVVYADDEEALVDFPALVATTKNEYVSLENVDGYQAYTIRKK